MSRLGKAPIPLPKGVEVKGSKGEIEIKGPKGTIKKHFPEGISVKVEESQVIVEFDEKSGLAKPMFGLYRSLLNNAIIGVSEGFKKKEFRAILCIYVPLQRLMQATAENINGLAIPSMFDLSNY